MQDQCEIALTRQNPHLYFCCTFLSRFGAQDLSQRLCAALISNSSRRIRMSSYDDFRRFASRGPPLKCISGPCGMEIMYPREWRIATPASLMRVDQKFAHVSYFFLRARLVLFEAAIAAASWPKMEERMRKQPG